ncbi:armadillo repeat-containing protein 2 [Cylas formicarius]|uniref:armadillo repeat-containing protein 2 n=1 Tax=Cylas formicarius TaxID=197179 RepID=UPI002958A0AC|nr:armadillo repeat-containing protein 2 [Cylas formicarius]
MDGNANRPRKTSAQIISEAREAVVVVLQSQRMESGTSPAVRPLQTRRPFTPRANERHLFGGTRGRDDRPASSFSLRYLRHEFAGHHFLKKSAAKRTVGDGVFNIGVKESCKVRLPSLEETGSLSKRKIFKNTSLEKLPEEGDATTMPCVVQRNAFSSPKERTDFDESERGGILLGPQNLTKIFDNRYIVENSERLFSSPPLRGDTVEEVLARLDAVDARQTDLVRDLLNELYGSMEKEGLVGSKTNPKIKIGILKGLYKFVESRDDEVLTDIARVILALNVTGSNLSGVCKLIFKISKNDKNDRLFLENNLLELFVDALGRSTPVDDAEACVYAYGAVKFLTMNATILGKMLALGILPLMVLHLKIVNDAKEDRQHFPTKTNHVLFQLTGALRNVLADEDAFEGFVACGTVGHLCHALELFDDDVDIVTNVARILSTASTRDDCCDALNGTENLYKVTVKLLRGHAQNEDIVVRLTYILGNLVARIDRARIEFFDEPGSIDGLVNLWRVYLERTLQLCSLTVENGSIVNSNSEDVMIKVIRVIANVVINPTIGKRTNETYGPVLIDEFLKVLISNPFKKNSELVRSVLSTLNNLSYYYSSDTEGDAFHVKQMEIVEAIVEYATGENDECVVETMRILGNLSRSKTTRSYIAETSIFDTLMGLLDVADVALLKTVVGVFVNLMSDTRCRQQFKEGGGVAKLQRVLKAYCAADWNLGTLVCQVLWNYSIDTVDLYETMGETELNDLLLVLAEFLDEEKLFGAACDETEMLLTPEYLLWEEFAGVATNLLEKIEYFLDTFDQIQVADHENVKSGGDGGGNVTFAAWQM